MTEEKEKINDIASKLLHDIEVIYGRRKADRSRRKFQYLQPHYADVREENIIDRLATAFDRLEEENKLRFQYAVIEALQRCTTSWLGITNTLITLKLAYRIARSLIPSGIWEKMLERRNQDEPEQTAIFLEQLIPLLRDWDIHVDIHRINYNSIIDHVSPRALVSTSEWLLQQAKNEPDISINIYKKALSAIVDHRYFNLWEARQHLEEAFLPGVPDKEKQRLLLETESTLSFHITRLEIKKEIEEIESFITRDSTSREDIREDATYEAVIYYEDETSLAVSHTI